MEKDIELHWQLDDEAELKRRAADVARVALGVVSGTVIFGLRGELGAGKTTWVRGMLEGLGHEGRVPSPTYALLENYPLDQVNVVHLDLYRLSEDDDQRAELDALGLKDWLFEDRTWLLVEWPARAPDLERRSDVLLDFEIPMGGSGRSVVVRSRSQQGEALVAELQSRSLLDSSLDS